MNSFEDRQNMKNKTSCAIVVTSILTTCGLREYLKNNKYYLSKNNN